MFEKVYSAAVRSFPVITSKKDSVNLYKNFAANVQLKR